MLDTTKKIEDTIENGAPDQAQNIIQNTPEPINQTATTDKLVEEAIESNPTAAEQVTEDISGENSPIETEAEQLNDLNPSNDEVNNEAIKQTPIKEKLEILDKLRSAGSSFINVPTSPKDDISLDSEPIDTSIGVAESAGDFTGPGNIEPLDDSQLPALNLQDYHKDLALDDERDLETTDNEKGPVEDTDYTVIEDSDYVPPTYTIEDLDREIEETRQLPVTNAEEAKEKQNKLKKLKARKVAYGGTSKSDTNWDYDKSTATGGKVSPLAGIGSIGGAAGHGSMAATSPTKIAGDNHNSIASKAPLPNALEDNQGKVVSVNGKATTAPSSNNNGAFRSGSFGLMSKAKSNLKSIKSKAPVSGSPKHMGNPMEAGKGIPADIGLEDGKQILIERLKQLLTQLTDEEKRKLGFSPALNQWNGKALVRLDGYTLQDLIDNVEKYLGEK